MRQANFYTLKLVENCKISPKEKFLVLFSADNVTGSLVPVDGWWISSKYIEILRLGHSVKLFQIFFRTIGLHATIQNLLRWRGYSLDFNAIENLWIILKIRLNKMDCWQRDTHDYKCYNNEVSWWLKSCAQNPLNLCQNGFKQLFLLKGEQTSYYMTIIINV